MGVWNLADDASVVVGSRLLCLGNSEHPKLTLYLHDEQMISDTMLLEHWVECLMAGVPEFAICFHRDGAVQSYSLYKLSELQRFLEERASEPRIAMLALGMELARRVQMTPGAFWKWPCAVVSLKSRAAKGSRCLWQVGGAPMDQEAVPPGGLQLLALEGEGRLDAEAGEAWWPMRAALKWCCLRLSGNEAQDERPDTSGSSGLVLKNTFLHFPEEEMKWDLESRVRAGPRLVWYMHMSSFSFGIWVKTRKRRHER